MHLPTDSQERKKIPLWTGVMKYFPDALVAIAKLSQKGNDQHNPGEPVHWTREKSSDHEDTLMRHLFDSDGVDVDGIPHCVKVAWRALAIAQLYLEKQKEHEKHQPAETHRERQIEELKQLVNGKPWIVQEKPWCGVLKGNEHRFNKVYPGQPPYQYCPTNGYEG